jgi:hypothetical protein
VMILAGHGSLVAVQEEALIVKARQHTDKLNAHLMQLARGSTNLTFLASPVTAGGISINRFHQLFLLAINQGYKQPAEWAQLTYQILAAQGQRLVKDGKTLETAEDNIAELTLQATTFATKQLPILKALQVV